MHGAEMRAALLEAAERLVDDGGVEALSVRAVADAVGTSTRAVYSAIGSRDDLVAALANKTLRAMGEDLGRLPVHDDPIEDLVNVGADVFRPFAMAHPGLFRVAFHNTRAAERAGPLVADDTLIEPAVTNFVLLMERVQRLEPAGLLGGWSVPAAVVAHSALCEGLATFELSTTLLTAGADELWRGAIRSLVTGFATAAPPGRATRKAVRRPRRGAS